MPRVAPENPIILIPARLASTRLPGKPLADIAGEPMIVHVWRRAVAAAVGPVVVACGDREIVEAIEAAGGRAMLTDPHHPTGSDRIAEAIERLDPDREFDAAINVQGDLPLLDPEAIRTAIAGLADPETDIATLAAVIDDDNSLADTSVNKVVAGFADPGRPARALYFSKAVVPWGPGRITSISGFTPTGGGRWRGSSRCRAASSNIANASNSCGPSKPACEFRCV